MNLVTPGLGLIFWQTLVFLVLLFLLTKVAWKPILGMLAAREKGIEEALQSAEKARRDMQNLKSENEKLLAAARQERDQMLRDAQAAGTRIVEEARAEAKKRADADLDAARKEIETSKAKAMAEIKNLVADLSVNIAEKLIGEKLNNDGAQRQLVDRFMTEANTKLS